MSISNIVSLLGGVALFLFGMTLMGDSLKKVAGSRLEVILYRLSGTQLKGIALGTGVTAVIQSSSATSVMVVGFVNSGMMKVRQAIGIIMGAIIGTSVTGWIICLSYLGTSVSGVLSLLSADALSSLVAVIGILLYMFTKDATKRNVGGILLGFAVLMFGMKTMSGSVSDLKDNETFIRLFTDFSNPLLGILAGIVFTGILQSASAAIGILQALSVTGAVSFSAAFPIIMGIAIGASVPVLLSALGAGSDGRRTALSYLLIDLFGAIIVAALFYTVNAFVDMAFTHSTVNPFSIAFVNTLFRLVMVVLLAPMTGLIERATALIVHDDNLHRQEMQDMDLLEDRFLTHPALAIEQSRLVINSMAGLVSKNLCKALAMVENYTPEDFEDVEISEDISDRYEDKLGTYLVKTTSHEMTREQNATVNKYLHAITDLERIGDHALNIAEAAREIAEKKISFSEAGAREVSVLTAAVKEICSLAVRAFIEGDLDTARRIEPLEEKIDCLCDEIKLHHVNRISEGSCTLQNGFVFNDLLTNLERVSDHCSNIGIAMIELDSCELDTHAYSVMVERTELFEKLFDEYDAKYSLETASD